MQSVTERYPLASQFLGGYLHQDWDLDYPSADAAVEQALSDWAEGGRLPDVQRELESLKGLGEPDLRQTLNRLCDYHPPGDGLSYREWLAGVVARLAAVT